MPTTRKLLLYCVIALMQIRCPANAEWPESFHDDASLNDVYFLTREIGWCVGARGTILHTIDSGESWERQHCPVDCSLESVYFVDENTGWAAGGRAIPYIQRSESVLLRTTDGGATWQRISTELLPWLKQIRFFDENNGIASSQSSDMYPSGIISTADGGRTWTGYRGRVADACQQLDVPRSRIGFGVTTSGQAVSIAPGEVTPFPIPATPRTLSPPFVSQCAKIIRPLARGGHHAIIFGGKSGELRRFTPESNTWQTVGHAAGPIALRAIATRNERVWTCGSPGKSILRSLDAGLTWQTFGTNSDLPLNAIHFADEDYGWAVGSMGTVLHTSDGGRTWRTQRVPASETIQRHAAFAVVTADPKSMPWSMVAELCAIEGFRAIVIAIDDFDFRSGDMPLEWRLDAATHAVGGNVGVVLPKESGTREIARQLQIWKPDAVLIHDSRDDGDFTARITAAIEIAATDDIRLNLEGHQVNRVADFHQVPWKQSADQVAIGIGATTSELASAAKAHFAARHQSAESTFRLDVRTATGNTVVPNAKNLISANSQLRGRSARRLADNIKSTYGQQQNNVVARRNIRAIALRAGKDAHAQTAQLLHRLTRRERSHLTFEFACQAEREGDYDTAISMLERITIDSPNHRIADAAAQMLLTMKASAEVELARTKRTANVATTVAAEAEVDLSSELDPAKPLQENRKASYIVASSTPQSFTARLEELLQIQKMRPGLFFSPTVRFPVAAFQRRANMADEANRFYRSQIGAQSDFAWRSVASTELGIADKQSAIVKPIAQSRLTHAAPLLDGQFDEPFWAESKPIELSKSDSSLDANVRIAYDQEFLYVAIECPKLPSITYEAAEKTSRQRDANMAGTDHVRLRFDCDRDYATHWEFAIDSRGNGHDRLNANASWNPIWYIAQSENESTWMAEIAVHLNELTGTPLAAGDAWAIAIERIAADIGSTHWPRVPSRIVLPQDFGILQFSP